MHDKVGLTYVLAGKVALLDCARGGREVGEDPGRATGLAVVCHFTKVNLSLKDFPVDPVAKRLS